jgi:hypothetical protein
MTDFLARALENLDLWVGLYGSDSPQVKLLRRLGSQTELSEDDELAIERLIDLLQAEAQPPTGAVGLRAMQVHALLVAMSEPKVGGSA